MPGQVYDWEGPPLGLCASGTLGLLTPRALELRTLWGKAQASDVCRAEKCTWHEACGRETVLLSHFAIGKVLSILSRHGRVCVSVCEGHMAWGIGDSSSSTLLIGETLGTAHILAVCRLWVPVCRNFGLLHAISLDPAACVSGWDGLGVGVNLWHERLFCLFVCFFREESEPPRSLLWYHYRWNTDTGLLICSATNRF